jgi:prepilin-type N-terminal cleavage/methylation domain-containing protein
MKQLGFKKGFTVVELLIVIVVIGILVLISVVSYGAITRNAADASLKGDLTEVVDLLESESFTSGYPATLSSLNNGAGPSVNSGTVLQYTGGGATYCVTVFNRKAGNLFNRSNADSTIKTGVCPGHSTTPY